MSPARQLKGRGVIAGLGLGTLLTAGVVVHTLLTVAGPSQPETWTIEPTLDLTQATDVDLLAVSALDPDDPYCRAFLDPDDTAIAQGMLFQIHDTMRRGLEPIPWEAEVREGDALHSRLVSGPGAPLRSVWRPQSADRRYLNALVQDIAALRDHAPAQFQVHVLDVPAPNAFATVGGHIYVTTGLMESGIVRNEAQLVGILAHEIGHIDLRHGAFFLDAIAQFDLDPGERLRAEAVGVARALSSVYSQQLEDEADRYAYLRLIRMGYSPFQWEDLYVALAEYEARELRRAGREAPGASERARRGADSHPPAQMRACRVRQLVRAMPPPERTYRGTSNFEDRIPASQQVR